MDAALRPYKNKIVTVSIHVSILVLMDAALRPAGRLVDREFEGEFQSLF